MDTDKSSGSRGFSPTLIVLAILALIAGVWMGNRLASTPEGPRMIAGGTILPEAKQLGEFALVDHKGEAFGPSRLSGKWTFVFFGYTHCPDICPTALTQLNAVAMKLEPTVAADTQFVFVSVDPERDTPELLSQFVPYFNKDFIGVTGKPEEISRVTRLLGIMYQRAQDDGSGTGYLVDHSASILLFNRSGDFAAVFSAPHVTDGIIAGYREARAYYDERR